MPKVQPRSPVPPDADLAEWLLVTSMRTFDPARKELRLAGRIFNDQRQRYPDGKWVITSALRTPMRLIVPRGLIRTQNTRYRLRERGTREDITLD
ncbi:MULTISPECIES: hypothetical protein [Sphingomonadaceae]|jgi:hypothetical protein|uniref:Uncharacterized protein n=2 Tax=Sphingomonadaceae TaxID=41297 RepID=A0A2K2FXW7_9SPHN|nr:MULTISPECIES: hypothetical protein [Sphingomonadaceae]KEZ21506.1 hypothetical protein CP98_00184 [Sphingobium yanoikuyae]MAM37465.1 hypothetical protein [Erythrobacter sp.]PNU03584.1 hypothetical protein A8V01_23470 [Novosphingobium guangzhouense]GFE77922.1 hypothetical protein NTCA1_55710 [Novosphingobium sp. TCA1]|tara:strand:- start:7931 stop:8215 length:285 start_codon:yes stop_codon:yes gene_type:complete